MAVRAGAKLGSTSLFGDSTSSLLGGSSEPTTSAKPKLDEVPLDSEAGMDYSTLRSHLQAGDFRQADDETRALMIKLAGEGAVKRGWVYFSEVKTIPSKDLKTMDALWKVASGGKFGFSVQREIYTQAQKRWSKFFKQIDWTQGENNIYRKWPLEFTYTMEAVRGHLPLTNALRGTQLLQALLEHPAFEKTISKRSIDDVTKEQSQSASKLF